MQVNIDDDTALEMLMDRVRYWTDNNETIELYRKMYESYIDSGCFSGSDFDVMSIVDNDYINWCDVIHPDDEHFEDALKAYKEGDRDVSCEHWGFDYVEAVSDDETAILVR